MPPGTAVATNRTSRLDLEVSGRGKNVSAQELSAAGDTVNIGRTDRISAAVLQHPSLRPQFLALGDTGHLDGKIKRRQCPPLRHQSEAGCDRGDVAGGADHRRRKKLRWPGKSFIERQLNCYRTRHQRNDGDGEFTYECQT